MVEAVVEFEYEAQQDDELSITVGDIILNIRKDEGGWWEGEVGGRRGFFPDNFVREIKKEEVLSTHTDLSNGSASPGSESSLRPGTKGEAIRKRRCKAAFSYVPQNEDELELKIGDIIDILGEVEEGWWEGSLNGRTGMFPSNFTKELQKDQEDPPPCSVKETGSESDGGDSSSRSDTGSAASSTEIQPKKVRGFGFGDIFKDQPIKLRPRSMDVENEVEKQALKKATSVTPETMKVDPDSKVKVKEYCKVLFPYEGQNEDELSIKEGEIVVIISKECADAGWWLGELNGVRGVFPDNFVKLIPEAEKERPKKPPPPVAPSSKTEKKTMMSSEVRKVPPERPDSLPQRAEDKGEEKISDIPKPNLPAVPPKKPLPPKSSSLGRPAGPHPKRPERPAAPTVTYEMSLSEAAERSSAERSSSERSSSERSSSERPNDIDLEDLNSVVLSTEKLNHPTAQRPRVTDRRPRSQILTLPGLLESPVLGEENQAEGKELDSVSPKSLPELTSRKSPRQLSVITEAKSPLVPKSSTHPQPSGANPALGPPSPQPKSEAASPGLEELRAQLRELRGNVELMKSQHKQEIMQLVHELDEEKRIRITLQMEVEHIKKVLSK